ncbi:actin-related protein 9 isoform X2 [Magnolia sinica]|uniref:actin-related protein 9 isoform X2 n=1 Tax=Magnolia sinica TaxID=86752 RepID=UPI00265A8B09|nr:actin-related protein 9 isoform X2 [Magnolia sinica]
MDYLKTVVPSQLIAERGSNLVVINPGSANIRIGLAHQHAPFVVPQCIAWYMRAWNEGYQGPKRTLQDQHSEREKAYDIIASLLKIPFLDEDTVNSYPRKMARVDGYNQQSRSDATFAWTDVRQKNLNSSSARELSESKVVIAETLDRPQGVDSGGRDAVECKYKEFICGEEALRISSTEPYCLRHPIRRGHLNISQHYPTQQVIEDLHAIWDWILNEKLHIPQADRNMFSAILVVPETFDSREIKEVLSIVLRDLRFGSAVVHQEGIAAIFGNGLSTACVVNMGAQVTSVICIDDGVALPTTSVTLPFGGEDISRCLLWVQRHHQTWPTIRTDPLAKPVDLLMLNKLKESYCLICGGELDAVTVVHSYEDGMPAVAHKTRMSALNVPPMGLFYPQLLVPDEYPPPPRSWFHDYEDMLEDSWHMDFPRRPDMPDGMFLGVNGGVNMWENYPVFPIRPKKEENLGLADAITSSILSAGRIDLQRKLFCSIQLIGGVALTGGLVGAVEERVLHAIPANEAIDTVEVLQSRTDPNFVTWKGGAILGVLDFTRDGWIHREDWIHNGIHVGSGRKYRDSYYLQGQAMSYISS